MLSGRVNAGYRIRDGKWLEIGRMSPQKPQVLHADIRLRIPHVRLRYPTQKPQVYYTQTYVLEYLMLDSDITQPVKT